MCDYKNFTLNETGGRISNDIQMDELMMIFALMILITFVCGSVSDALVYTNKHVELKIKPYLLHAWEKGYNSTLLAVMLCILYIIFRSYYVFTTCWYPYWVHYLLISVLFSLYVCRLSNLTRYLSMAILVEILNVLIWDVGTQTPDVTTILCVIIIIGTLIGLVLLLAGLTDPDSIGTNMSTALVTTLYGVVLSNLIFFPLAGRMRILSNEELLQKEMYLEGLVALSEGASTYVIREKMSMLLPLKERMEITKIRDRKNDVRKET